MKGLDLGAAMREGMRRLASGVSILTVRDSRGERFAMTASSITSVSDDPASLLVCVNKETAMCRAMADSQAFCVNLLSYGQQHISEVCATGDQGEIRFATGTWIDDHQYGLPMLESAQAAFLCEHDQCVPYGTHEIYIGRIERVLVHGSNINPLIYLNGDYHQAKPE